MFDLIGAGLKIIDKVVPDRAKADEAKLRFLELQQAGELKELEFLSNVDVAQANVNLAEAQSTSFFKSSWRPFLCWSLTIALIFDSLIRPYLDCLLAKHGYVVPPINGAEITGLLVPLLGIGTFRTFEKLKGITK